jgi:hypothetical protein
MKQIRTQKKMKQIRTQKKMKQIRTQKNETMVLKYFVKLEIKNITLDLEGIVMPDGWEWLGSGHDNETGFSDIEYYGDNDNYGMIINHLRTCVLRDKRDNTEFRITVTIRNE